ncbi:MULTISPECIES: hypothetical protein [Myroides]|uniref:Uncharacterized protein n=1 Tax=Myroides albus TaxID=2562892 RepID=A0A6I3LJS0_9FLAO|nr:MULTISPECIES: hypothetical protein [Myroides]MTG98087.1 hypothetical protein [Myroides albus]MVX36275.1 hypothetical protein [Myroides sp. LoEW2-1]UVD80732.1 hypothetical protein NWE55_05660 [Myroides albus]
MKKIYIIIVFIVLFRPVAPLVEYWVNYEYVSKVLCENVSKPELECNGKCHLSNELSKSFDKSGKLVFDKYNTLYDYLVSGTFRYLSFELALVWRSEALDSYVNNYNYLQVSSLLDPPIF